MSYSLSNPILQQEINVAIYLRLAKEKNKHQENNLLRVSINLQTFNITSQIGTFWSGNSRRNIHKINGVFIDLMALYNQVYSALYDLISLTAFRFRKLS